MCIRDRLSVHYFDRLVTDPAQMTDLPATQRAELVQALSLIHI